MGRTRTDLVVKNPNTEDDPQTIRNALVETGATHTVLPAPTLEAMGIKPTMQVPVRIGGNSAMDVGRRSPVPYSSCPPKSTWWVAPPCKTTA